MSVTIETEPHGAAAVEEPLLAVRGISKKFGHVDALRDVSVDVRRGEVMALIGDNGAGKSTLIKVLSGFYSPDDGTIRAGGRTYNGFARPSEASAAGIATVYQDLALVDARDVAANIFLGREFRRGPFVDAARGRREAQRVIDELHSDIPSVRVPVSMLSGGQRQAVAIARALVQGGELVILDEPTAALGPPETERVLDLCEELRARGTSVVIVSHNLEHVVRIADRIAVMYRGRLVAVKERGASVRELVHLLVAGVEEEGPTR